MDAGVIHHIFLKIQHTQNCIHFSCSFIAVEKILLRKKKTKYVFSNKRKKSSKMVPVLTTAIYIFVKIMLNSFASHSLISVKHNV